MNRPTIARATPILAAMTLLGACAAIPAAPASGRGTLWGYVRAIPRDGATPGQADGGPYADRRFRDVKFVDYRHPGFVVVYLDGARVDPEGAGLGRDGARTRGGTTRVTIQSSAFGPRFVPRHTAIEVGDTLVLKNADSVPHTLACPDANLLHRVPAGEEVTLASPAAGALSVFLLDAPNTAALIFVAPGPYAIASEDGRWELRDLHPGQRTLHAWHPRLPAGEHQIDVSAGGTRRIDLQVGVGNLTTSSAPRSDGDGAGGGDAAGSRDSAAGAAGGDHAGGGGGG